MFRYLAITILLPFLSGFTLANAQSSPVKTFTVTIDAGHGGKDTGAPGKKSVEKNIALEIALKLGHYIESLMEDVNVYYTRKTDVFIPLYERAPIANRNKSNLFISIHVNANKKSAPTGTATYVMGFSKSAENLDLVMQENKAMLLEPDYQEKYQGFDPTSPQEYILFNNVQTNNLAQSLEVAAAVQDQLRTRAQRKDIGIHQGNLVVLWKSTMPSILVETGFISNPQEEEFLMTENGQDIIASAIYMAVRNYKESVDAKVSSITQNTVSETPTVKKPTDYSARTYDSVKKQADTEKRADIAKKTIDSVKKPAEAEKKAEEAVKIAVETEKKVSEPEKKASEPEKKASEPVKKALEPEKKTIVVGEKTAAGVEFRVQVLASLKSLPPAAPELKGVKGLEELQLDGYYKYMSKSVKTYPEALDIKQQLVASFQGAFIVAFRDGVKVPVSAVYNPGKK